MKTSMKKLLLCAVLLLTLSGCGKESAAYDAAVAAEAVAHNRMAQLPERAEEAERRFEEAARKARKGFGADSPVSRELAGMEASILSLREKWDRAEKDSLARRAELLRLQFAP